MDDRIKDYLKLGSLLLLNIALYFLIFWLESNMSRLSNPSDFVLIARNFILLAIPSILAYKIILYYNIMRQSIASLAILNIVVILCVANIKSAQTLILIGLLLCWHIILYLSSVRKEKKQIEKEEGQSVE